MPVYKDAQRGTWYISASYSPRKGVYKKLVKRGYRTKKEAREQEYILMSQLDKNGIGNTPMIVDVIFEEYMKYAGTKIKQSTIESRLKHYENHIKPSFGTKDMLTITPKEIVDWQNELLKKMKASSLQIIHTSFNVLYSYIFKMYDISHNPLRQAGYVSKGNERKKHNLLDMDDFKVFIKNVEEPIFQILFRLLFTTGLRIGEALCLNWSDFKNGKLSIHKTISNTGKISSPKTINSHRELTIDNEMNRILLEWKKTCQQEDEYVSDGFIFGNCKTLTRYNVRVRLSTALKLSNLPHMSPHDFRHSYVSLLVDAGCDINAVAEIIGDTVETASTVYTHMFSRKKNIMANFFVNA